MTDTSNMSSGAPAAAQPKGPSLRVLSQFIKDLSFENPGSVVGEGQPNIDLGIDVSATPHQQGNGLFEVSLKMNAKAAVGDNVLFLTELDYGGIFQLENFPESDMEPMLLIECPRLLFPYARRIISEITRDGGFPPLMIDPVDFVALYQSQKARAAQGTPPPQV